MKIGISNAWNRPVRAFYANVILQFMSLCPLFMLANTGKREIGYLEQVCPLHSIYTVDILHITHGRHSAFMSLSTPYHKIFYSAKWIDGNRHIMWYRKQCYVSSITRWI